MAGYETREALKAQMNKTNTDKDVTIDMILEAASRGIDRFCNRPDGFNADDDAVSRIYRGSGRNWQNIDECVAVTLVEVKESVTVTAYTAWTVGDWIAMSGDPADPDFNSLPFDALMVDPTGDQAVFTGAISLDDVYFGSAGIPSSSRDLYPGRRAAAPTVRVTARWGYAAETPEPIRQACAMQAIIWYKRMEGAMASALANPELGTIELFKALDPAVEFLLSLGRYVKPATGRR